MNAPAAIETQGLSKVYPGGHGIAEVTMTVAAGEVFGFLGPNGAGKTTTIRTLLDLIHPTAGSARILGLDSRRDSVAIRARLGNLPGDFGFGRETTGRRTLGLLARLRGAPIGRADELAERFRADLDRPLGELSRGNRQKVGLILATFHRPELLILDEPTSGVDPIARDTFWRLMIDLSRNGHVTIFISTHFMNEAARCDRISLMHAGRVLVSDTPAAITAGRGAVSLEEAFIAYLREAAGGGEPPAETPAAAPEALPDRAAARRFSLRRTLSYSRREALELRRDPIRATLALLGSVLLLFIMGYGISLDVENLPFAVLDRDGTTTSQNYVLNLAGSRYFVERPPITDYAALDRRMRSGELSVAVEIPPNFARDLRRGDAVSVAMWIDGAMPQRAETVQGYVQALHAQWLGDMAVSELGSRAAASAGLVDIETRYRYNPDVESLIATVPAVIPILLLLIPAMLTALSVVREKELGSIVNFYVTPITRIEFLLGKQLPYAALALLNFATLVLLALFVFRVPISGNVLALSAGAALYALCATAIGLLFSTFMRSQIAAIFATAIGTILPAVQFSGLINPISSLEGAGALIGHVFPATHFISICRGVFSKGLGFADLRAPLLSLAATYPLVVALCAFLLRKQER
jgi:ribosome-dependent ATPase